METVIGILKKHGLYTDEFRHRMDILEAVSKGDWDSPILKANFTPEQIAEMQRPPPAQGGGVAELSKKAMDKAVAVASSDSAQQAADYARGVATGAFSKGKSLATGAVPKLKSMRESIGSKLSTINPARDIPKEMDPDSADGFITMVVKWGMRMMMNAMASPSWPMIVKTVFGFVFVLSYAQGIPIFGGMIRATLEIVAFILPTIGRFIVSVATAIGGPFGNPVGILLGAVFFILAGMIAFSRKQFTEVVVVMANLIPFIGDFVSSSIQKLDNSAAKIAVAQRQVVNSFMDILSLVFGQGKPAAPAAAPVKSSKLSWRRSRGGMRFSRRRRHTKKWRTMRRPFGTR
jgi:hypothetical protein